MANINYNYINIKYQDYLGIHSNKNVSYIVRILKFYFLELIFPFTRESIKFMNFKTIGSSNKISLEIKMLGDIYDTQKTIGLEQVFIYFW